MGGNYSPGRPGMGRPGMGGMGRPGMEQSPQFGGRGQYGNRMPGASPQTQRGPMGPMGGPRGMQGLGGSPQRPEAGAYGGHGTERFGRPGMGGYGGRPGFDPRMDQRGMSPGRASYGGRTPENGRITGNLQGYDPMSRNMTPRGDVEGRRGAPGPYGMGGRLPRTSFAGAGAGVGRDPMGARGQPGMNPGAAGEFNQRRPGFRPPQGIPEQERAMMGRSPQECPLKRQGLLRSNELFPDVGVNGSQLSENGSVQGTPLGGRFQQGEGMNSHQMGPGPYSEYQDIAPRATGFGLDRPWMRNNQPQQPQRQQHQPPQAQNGFGNIGQYDPSRSPGRYGESIRPFMGQSRPQEQAGSPGNGRYHSINVHDGMNRSMVGERGEQPQREVFNNGRQFNTVQDYKGIRAGIPDRELNQNAQNTSTISPITIRGERPGAGAGAGALGERNPNVHPYAQEANNMTQIPQGGVNSPYNKTYVNKGPGNYEEIAAQAERFGMNPSQKMMQQSQSMPGQGMYKENMENSLPMMQPNQRFTPIGGPNYREMYGRSIEDTHSPAGGILNGRINQQAANYRQLTGRANDEIIHQPPNIDDLYAPEPKNPQTPIREDTKQAPHVVIPREKAVYADGQVGYSYSQAAQEPEQPAQEKPNKKVGKRDFNSRAAFESGKADLRNYQKQADSPSFMERVLAEDYVNGRGTEGFMQYVEDFREDLMLSLQVRDELMEREFKSCPLMLPKYTKSNHTDY